MTRTANHLPIKVIEQRAVVLAEHEKLIAAALSYTSIRFFEKGDRILETGSRDHAFYYLRSGAVEISYTKNKKKNIAALARPGQFFGEVGFFDHGSRTRNIIALEESELSIFTEEALRRFQTDDPELYGRFLSFLTRSICAKFRRVLNERQISTTYAASLTPNKKSYDSCRRPLTDEFLQSREWRLVNPVIEDFKSFFFDLTHTVQEDPGEEIAPRLQIECSIAMDKFNLDVCGLEEKIRGSRHEETVWGYLFKETFPYLIRSRFVDRVYYKHKGYAGDFKMIEHLYANRPAGEGKIGRMIDQCMLLSPAGRAIRGRRRLLVEQLKHHTGNRAVRERSIRIMNLACGSNRELFDFLIDCSYTEKIKATCIDLDTEALQFTNQHVNTFPHHASIRLLSDNLIKWALGRNRYHFPPQDIIYSSGLMDYFERRLFLKLVNRCYDQLKPGGILILGNFAPTNPNRPMMDHVFHWRLIHRDENELRDIFAHSLFGTEIEVISEKQGINLFAVAVKKK